MGETPAETLSEIEITRSKIEQDLDVLEERLPERDRLTQQAKQLGMAAAGGGVGLTVLWLLVRRWRHNRADERRAERQAELLAAKLPGILNGERPTPAPSSSGGATGVLALLVAVAALVLGMIQYRTAKQVQESSPYA